MFFREGVEAGVIYAASCSRKRVGGGTTAARSIAPGASVPLTCDTGLHSPDRDQRQRLRMAVHCQQLLKVPQYLTQVVDAALLPAPDYGVLERK